MRNVFLKSACLLAACAFSLAASGTVCPPGEISELCNDSADLQLSGTVEAVCELSIEALPEATALDIMNGETDTPVGLITVETNNPAGYRLEVSSANGGVLKNGDVLDAVEVPYTLSHNDLTAISPETTPTEVLTQANDGGGFVSDVVTASISFAGQPDAGVGMYSDTLTYTATAL